MRIFKILTLFVLFCTTSFSQFVFKDLPEYKMKEDSTLLDISSTRSIINLNGNWKVYSADDEDKVKSNIKIPAMFEGEGELVFEKIFSLDKATIANHVLRLKFLGLNYSADISLNKRIIYRHTGGEFPFSFELPKDFLKEKNNVLSVKINYQPDAENTIPVKQKFLFPKNYGGIFNDVYLHVVPNINLSEISLNSFYNPVSQRAKINVFAKLEHKKRGADSSDASGYQIKVKMISNGTENEYNLSSVQLSFNKERTLNQSFDVVNPTLWTPQTPKSYRVYIEIWKGDVLIDRSKRTLSIYSLQTAFKGLTFNGEPFTLSGTTFVPSNYDLGTFSSYEKMERDIRLIKETGFNAVRFSGFVPHPYYLLLCEQKGLIAFVELPLNFIPSAIVSDQNFIERSHSYLDGFLKAYNRYSIIAALGIGSSFSYDIEEHRIYLKDMAGIVKQRSSFLTYASFSDLNEMESVTEIPELDMYGLEYINKNVADFSQEYLDLQAKISAGKLFVSSAMYAANIGGSNGYSNPFTFEAQAKFFEELINFTDKNNTSGYFINSFYDYRGGYASLIAGYTPENRYQIGLVGEDRNTNRMAYKVVYAKLHNQEKVTVPIGSPKDKSPMVFIIFGIILALFMGVLVNSGRKFREDSSRALLRPYNFYADVRDQRIMSMLHTAFLSIVVAAVSALLLSNLLYYLKENIGFERLLLSFGNPDLVTAASYLAWNPIQSLLYLSLATLLLMFAIIIVVKIASFFIRNRVYISGIFYIVVWSFLPLILLIPLGIILFRLFDANLGNFYIVILLGIFTLWIIFRLIKGIYVIFDVHPNAVYFYSILLVLLVAGGLLFYYQMNNSVLDYIKLTLHQYNIFG